MNKIFIMVLSVVFTSTMNGYGQNKGLDNEQSVEQVEADIQTIIQTTLVQRFWPEQIVNYIGVPAFHSKSWRIGEQVQIGDQLFTIDSIRVSGTGSIELGTLASFDIVVLTEKPTMIYPTGTPVKYLGNFKSQQPHESDVTK
jgi:hypothetical protein